MFKPIENLVSLTDSHLDYLKELLNVEKLVGISSNYPRMNKEDKLELKDKMDKYFADKKISRTDFFGTAIVSTEYISFVKMIENPDYHASAHIVDFDNNCSQLRKIYSASGKWFGLEYYTHEAFVAGNLVDKKDALDYFLKNINQSVEVRELSEEAFKPAKFNEIQKFISMMTIIDQYEKDGDLYNRTQKIYAKLKNNTWATIESDDGENAKIVPLDISVVSLDLEG